MVQRPISAVTEYVGQAFVVEADGDEVEVRASLRTDGDESSGDLIGPADWVAIAASTEPFFELRLPDRRSRRVLRQRVRPGATDQRVAISGIGSAPF
jgi:hypothetical protein